MCDPACKEQRDSGGGRVRRIQAGVAEKVTRVIERHDDHDDAAHHVNRFDAYALGGTGIGDRGHLRSLAEVVALVRLD